MMQYITKDSSELKSDAEKLCRNMSPLIGCKTTGIGWSPFTGLQVCSAISVNGLSCSNIPHSTATNGILSYKFTSDITNATASIWRSVTLYDTSVLNTDYVSFVSNLVKVNSSMADKLKVTAASCKYTDSTIFDAAYKNPKIKLTQSYYNICHILLSCFTLRYYLFEYAKNNVELNTSEVNESVINRIVENIDYVKYILSQEESMLSDYHRSAEYTRQHLTTLRKNLLMIRPNVLVYIKN